MPGLLEPSLKIIEALPAGLAALLPVKVRVAVSMLVDRLVVVLNPRGRERRGRGIGHGARVVGGAALGHAALLMATSREENQGHESEQPFADRHVLAGVMSSRFGP